MIELPEVTQRASNRAETRPGPDLGSVYHFQQLLSLLIILLEQEPMEVGHPTGMPQKPTPSHGKPRRFTGGSKLELPFLQETRNE